VLFNSFVVAGALYLALELQVRPLAWTILALGLASLFAVDMVYKYAWQQAAGPPHSASVFLTGLLLAGVFASNPALALTAAALKLALYVARKVRVGRAGTSLHPLIIVPRVLLGLVVPAVLWLTGGVAWWLVPALVLTGEVIDRCEYYAEMVIMTPSLQMAIDLETRLRGTVT
jgi:hypothetical protein